MHRAAPRLVRAIVTPIGVAACVAVCSGALTQQAVATGTHLSSRCATFHTNGIEYGVYVGDGHVKCSVATGILKAIAGGKGKYVHNGHSYNSYTLYGGWLCPSGNMGEQTCEHSKHLVSHPSQDIASLSCSFGTGCPKEATLANE